MATFCINLNAATRINADNLEQLLACVFGQPDITDSNSSIGSELRLKGLFGEFSFSVRENIGVKTFVARIEIS